MSPSQKPSSSPTRAPTRSPSANPSTKLPTVKPSVPPTLQPTRPSASPTVKPSVPPTIQPSRPSACPTVKPSSNPTFQPSTSPTPLPSVPPTLQPLGPGYELMWSGGTNDVVAGVDYVFHGLYTVSQAFLKVDVFPTNFGDPSTEYVTNITANGIQLSSYCAPAANNGSQFYTCFRDVDVVQLIDRLSGTLDVRVRASVGVDAYAHNGFLLYVQFTLSGLVFPTGQPTSIPTSMPSSLPTGCPTAQPTSLPTFHPSRYPTGSPTGQPSPTPTGKPSRAPTSQPSERPSAHPTSSPTTLSPTFSPSLPPSVPYMWLGGSGFFDAPEKWNHLKVPGASNQVTIFLNSNEKIYIPSGTIILGSLNYSGDGWIVYAAPTSSILVEGQMTYFGGYINGYGPSSVLSAASCVMMGSSKKILQTISLNVTSLLWSDGILLLGNATVLSNEVATFSGLSSSVTTKKASSFYNFDDYNGSMLNTGIDFRLAFPPGNAVYDLIVNNAIRVTESTNSFDSWPLEIESDVEAAIYYAYYVGIGNESLSIYSRSIQNIDVDSCADICSAYSWCMSFDYLRTYSSCLLSAFSMRDVGGLVDSVDGLTSHFEKRSMEKAFDSKIMLAGSAVVDYPGLLSQVSTVTADNTNLTIRDAAFLVVTSGGLLAKLSSINIGCATFAIFGSSFYVTDSHLLHASCEGNSSIYINGGVHYFDGNSLQIPILRIENGSLYFPSNITVSASNISVAQAATLYFEGSCNVFNATVANLYLGGSVTAGNITIIAHSLSIDQFSFISALGGGALRGMGLGAGADDPVAASGGSYGGTS